LTNIKDILKNVGEPLVRSAFDDVLTSKISSLKAKKIIRIFSHRWKDYARPALVVFACKAVHGDPSLVDPAVKALVLSGGAFDLHDDIIDHSYVRKEKKRKSLLGIYGPEATLLVGDALLIGGLSCLYQLKDAIPKDRFENVADTIKQGLFELGSAEMEELKLIRNLQVTTKKYLQIVHMKAADAESYTRVGGIIGGGSKEEIDALGRFGRLIGIIAILRDDIEDTFNDKVELSSRLTKESLPLPIVISLKDSALKLKLQKIYASISNPMKLLKNEDLCEILSLVEKNHGFEKTVSIIEQHIKEAKSSIEWMKEPKLLLSLFKS
jgi:geranylgeranyl pyrophosphate synthase